MTNIVVTLTYSHGNPSFQFIRELNLNSFFQGAKKVADKDAKFL